jgi:hypothetical protein
MKPIIDIFSRLKGQATESDRSFTVLSLPGIKSHKIGVSKNALPLFFISCTNLENSKFLDYNLEAVAVKFNCECELVTDGNDLIKGYYTIVSLKTESDLLTYFLEVVYLIVKKIPERVELKDLKLEVDKLIALFSKFSAPPQKTIQGLWSELLVIEQAKSPDYLVRAWHSTKASKFDFNDGIDKIEVKSTAKSRRIHTFSSDQLNPNKNSNLIIASVFAVESGVGKSIFDLISKIELKLVDKELIFRVNEVVIETLGRDVEKAFDIFFDYNNAVDSLAYFESESIPKIHTEAISSSVFNIQFDCDLSGIKSMLSGKEESSLHQSLI